MNKNNDKYQLTEPLSSILNETSSTEIDYDISSKRIKHKLYKFSIYDVDVIIDDNERFIGIESIRISKSFIEATKLPDYIGKSAEELIDDFLKEQDD